VITPPFATAATNAAEVQLSGVPVPTTVVGLELSSAWASAGTGHFPAGLPAGGPSSGFGITPDEDPPPPDEEPPPPDEEPLEEAPDEEPGSSPPEQPWDARATTTSERAQVRIGGS